MTLKEVANLILQHNNFDILTHNYPDGDCIGSAFALAHALKQIGKNARVITTDRQKKFEFLFESYSAPAFEREYVISTDVADEKLLGANRKEYEGKIDLCIDHHKSNVINAPYKYVDADSAAAGEIIYELIPLLGAEYTKVIADCLYTAISTDTGCFRYTNTTSRTMRIAAELIDLNCDSGYINKEMFETKSKARVELEREILESMIFCADDKCAIIYTTREMTEGLGDDETEGIASIPRQIEGVKMGITVREKEKDYKVSVRTNDGVDACAFCKQFGGGGHVAASGCTLKGDLQSVLDTLIEAAEKIL
ncbi:MAG: bifunctional oligoribonuclease/PAP phosphatase NrnA [Ruminococcus sp.]|nr:bifunctional oligoribonuclease/PAP phosphatase NrnA [Ruminococcus sp.]